MLWPNEGDSREVKILNRIVVWDPQQGLSYEADPRHVEIVTEQLQLQHSKHVATPGAKEEGNTQEDHTQPLGEADATKYRALVARCNHAPDRPDIAFAVNELPRSMAIPTKGDMTILKRLGRYLLEKPRLRQWHGWQPSQYRIKTYSDADWAGCKSTRKSTTGGVITVAVTQSRVGVKLKSLLPSVLASQSCTHR